MIQLRTLTLTITSDLTTHHPSTLKPSCNPQYYDAVRIRQNLPLFPKIQECPHFGSGMSILVLPPVQEHTRYNPTNKPHSCTGVISVCLSIAGKIDPVTVVKQKYLEEFFPKGADYKTKLIWWRPALWSPERIILCASWNNWRPAENKLV